MQDHFRFVDVRIVCVVDDIAAFEGSEAGATAIVNAANNSLLGGSGVDGAIHRAAGPALLKDCEALRRTTLRDELPTGAAVMTGAGRLPATHVIHTVGPAWTGGASGEPEMLRIAETADIVKVAIPALLTGVFGYPLQLAAPHAAAIIRAHVGSSRYPERFNIVFFEPRDTDTFARSYDLARQE